MKAKRIEIVTLLCAGLKKTETSKQLNISRMTVHRVQQRLKASVSLQVHPRLRRPQVIGQEATKNAFEMIHARK